MIILTRPSLSRLSQRFDRSRRSGFGRIESRALPAAIAILFALFATTSATAALREFRLQFVPSQSASAAGYSMHVGTASGDYDADFDLGSPPMSGATVIYAVDLEDSTDVFVALRSYDAAGLQSAYSNEIRVAAAEVVVDPPPPVEDGGDAGDGGGEGSVPGGGGNTPPDEGETNPDEGQGEGEAEGEGEGDGGSGGGMPGGGGGGDMPDSPMPMADHLRVGLTTASDGMISTLLSDGSLDFLTMDSLASRGNLRPARCDLDGDADMDIVIGFGAGSEGQVALLFLEDGAISSVSSISAGPDAYRSKSGRTNPACGDIDGDGRGELVIGFGLRMRGVIQILDDVQTGFAPFASARSDMDGYLQTPVPDRFWGPTYPAVGDLDGDGRGEVVVGLGRTTGGGRLIVFDDAQSDFAIHAGNRTGEPWLRIDPKLTKQLGRTRTMPAVGDLDGDGRDEIAVGFGMGSGSVVAILQDTVDGLPEAPSDALLISTGRAGYARKDGATRVSIGDLDGDAAEELVVSFQRSGDHEVQVLDDLGASMAPMGEDDGFVVALDRAKRLHALPME